MGYERVMIPIATALTITVLGGNRILYRNRKKIRNHLVHEYTHNTYQLKIPSKEVEKIAPIFDSIYNKDACIGGSAALKLYTKKDFTPSNIDIFTTVARPEIKNTSIDLFPNTPPIKTQVIHIPKPLPTMATWYITYSDMNICVTKLGDHYIFQFSSKVDADMMRDGYLRLSTDNKKRAEKYEKYGFITNSKRNDQHRARLIKKYRNHLKVPFFSWENVQQKQQKPQKN